MKQWIPVAFGVAHGLACLWASRHIHPSYPKWTAKAVVGIGIVLLVLAGVLGVQAWIGGGK